jgi:tetratricopeptide (TPR) repeat protein
MAACYFGAMYASARGWRDRHATRWLVTAAGLCVVGALCKETIATAPVAILLYDRAFAVTTFAEAIRRRWRFYLALTGTWAVVAGQLLLPGQMNVTSFSTAPTSAWTYLLNQAIVIPNYLKLAVWPRSLVLFYGWSRPITVMDVWPWALGLSILAAASLLLYLRRPRRGYALVWFFLTLAPTSSILPLPSEVGAERRMYLPLAGLVVWAVVASARSTASRKITGVVAALACVGLATATMERNREYGSSLGMAETIVARWPSPGADYLLGTELAAAGRHNEAITHLLAASDETPPADYYLGAEFFKTGHLDEAIAHLQRLVVRAPNLPIVRPSEVMIARAYALKGDWPHAVEECARVLSSWPADPDANGILADAMAARQDFASAIPRYRVFLAAQPANAVGWTSLGLALVATNDANGAADAFAHAADAAPADAHVRVNLARALLDAHRAGEAAAAAAQAVALAPRDPAAHEVLGRTLAASGRMNDARRELESALSIDPGYAPALDALRQLGIRRESPR